MTLAEYLLARLNESERDWRAWEDDGSPGPWSFLIEDVEAKRKVVALHAGDHECSVYHHRGELDRSGGIKDTGEIEIDNCAWVAGGDACTTLRLLALPYVSLTCGYREEWRP